ncbi:MAG: PASTA domain-containing protein [Nocardioidaceae bacterium]
MQPDDEAQTPPEGVGPYGGDLSDPLIGRILDGRYRIGTRIARGGMASVYRAADLRLDRTVAVKVMHLGLGDDREFAARFVREARAAARISHPNVVAVYDQGDDNGVIFLAMELISGHTLRDVIRHDAPLSPARSLAFFEPVVAALAAAHRAGLIHRDIKPENVLIADDGRIKVADFGLAKAVSADTQHTATGGVLIGTVSYLAPELVVDGSADARADVYAAGVMLYEMLTGAKPHEGESPIQVAYKHVHEDIPAPSATVGRIPAYVDALVARATSRDRSLRPADADVLLHQVRRVSQALADGVFDDPELVSDLMPVGGPAAAAAAAGMAEVAADDYDEAGFDEDGQYDDGQFDEAPDIADHVAVAEGPVAAEEPPPVAPPVAPPPPAWQPPPRVEDPRDTQPSMARVEDDEPYDQERDDRFDVASVSDADLAAALAPGAAAATVADADIAPGEPRIDPPLGRVTSPHLAGEPPPWADFGASMREQTTRIPEMGGTATAVPPGGPAFGQPVPPAAGPGRPGKPPRQPKAPKQPKPPRQRRSVKGPLLVALAVLLLAGVATGAWWFGIGRYTTTPGVLGLTQDSATAKLEDAGLKVDLAEPQFSEEVPQGEVIASDPKPGTKILRHATITLTISLGKERYKVPQLVGLTEDKAQDRILAHHLAFGKSTRVFSEKVPRGRVISSSPRQGIKLKRDSVVDLVVSKGRKPINFADWTGKDAATAKKALEAKGLVVDISNEEYSDTVPAGSVIAQDPRQGPLFRGDKVTLVVSKGPEMVTIPTDGIIAAGVEAATAKLEGLGFVVKTKKADGYLGLGFVQSTDPAPGTSVPKGSTITLFLI